GKDICFAVALDTIERAEAAEFLTDIRIVDVPIDDIADDVVRMKTLPNLIGAVGQVQNVGLFKDKGCLIGRDSFSFTCRFEYGTYRSHKNSILRTDLIAATSAAFS